jgi:hypothetical protein
MEFSPSVLVTTNDREFRWKGRLLFPGLFDGEHYFLLEDSPSGGTHFRHGERFSGLLVNLLRTEKQDKRKYP